MNIKIELADGTIKEFKNIKSYKETLSDWKDGSVFDIKNGNKYYYIISNGVVHKGINGRNGEFDDSAIKFGNACKDKEYAERRAKEIKLYNHLSNFAEVVNEGWSPDWTTSDEKYYISYNHGKNIYCTEVIYIYESLREVYFKSKELAQRAIDEIILPFERGEL